jgi:dipeptide/tripeptide permease
MICTLTHSGERLQALNSLALALLSTLFLVIVTGRQRHILVLIITTLQIAVVVGMLSLSFTFFPQLGRFASRGLLLDLLVLSPLRDLLLELAGRHELFRLLGCFGHCYSMRYVMCLEDFRS